MVFQLLSKRSVNDQGLAVAGWSTVDLFINGGELNLVCQLVLIRTAICSYCYMQGGKSIPVYRPPVNPSLSDRERDPIGGARLNVTIFLEGEEDAMSLPSAPATPRSSLSSRSQMSTRHSLRSRQAAPHLLRPPSTMSAYSNASSAHSTVAAPPGTWQQGQRPSLSNEVYEEHAGFDLYIDGARFLPYNVTISKVNDRE